MTALPSSAALTNFAATSGTMKTVHTDLRAFLAGLLGEDGTPATALAALGAVGGGYIARTGAYTVTLADRGKLIHATSGTWTLALPAAATAGAGFAIQFLNTGGTVTIDPNGAELIDGVTTLAVGANRSGLIVSTGSAWRTVGQIGSVTISATDATAGRLLKTGDFGVGGQAADIDVNAAGLATRFFRGTTQANNPTTSNNYHGIHISRLNDAQGAQIAVREAGTPQLMAFRARSSGGTWDAWNVLYGRLNTIGTVSQSGGTPTGELIERGANDNGQYVRWADGTQICFRQADIAAADTAVAWAATFATAAYRATVFALSANPFFTGYGLKNVGDFTPRAWNSSGTRVVLSNAEIFAIGRWF
jgi:hypothetical protein